MKVFAAFSPTLRWNLAILFAAGLCFWAGLAGLLPTLPLFIETLGATGSQIGVVMASFAFGLLIARPSLARLADEQGRKRVLLIGIIAVAIAPFLYLTAIILPPITWQLSLGERTLTINGILALLMAFRAFHGLSIAAFVVAYSALVIDISPPANRGELIGYMSLVNPIGMAMGPALGGFLLEWKGFSVAFLAMGILGLLGIICVTQVKETYAPAAKKTLTNAPRPLFWSLLWTPRVRTPAIILLLVGLAFGTLSTFVPLFIKETGLALNVGLIYTASATASFASRLLVGRASDRYGRGRFITVSLLLYTLAMLAFWQAKTPTMFLLSGLIQGGAAGTLIPMIAALMGDRAAPDERGKIFGLVMVGFDVGIALAGPLFGTFADWASYRDCFGLAGLMTFIGFLVFITASSKDLVNSLQFSLGQGRDAYATNLPPAK
ncbi:MFS transporter [Oscillatoria sp. CS-180]|uniref:MFS transporter n=1 Tax=Oscillatoria sp. CS-180 TaxID=3021720 RepID=UPI00232E3295|nr:MFS transporter [Oscillatoria sp. CS-180]MDB9526639.1 MFS transporter [Oscillatoria sp. CS-180]